ncbi:MAG: DNA-directed RNA polymerase subunit RpoH/Rpb5 C-terminal domain-containing protein [Candidatus Woesearchaeota archaeon]
MMEASDSPDKDRRLIIGMNPATNAKATKTILVLLDKYSNYISAAQQFIKLLNKIPDIKSSHLEFNLDIIIVPYENPGSNITNKLLEYASAGSEESGYIRFMVHDYSFFTSNKMQSTSISPSRIVSKEEEKRVSRELCAKKSSMGKIRVIDAVSVWLGAEIGDVIEEDIPSEATGIERNYRFVRA